MEANYQEQQTQFLSNNNGTSPQEILLLGIPVHSSLLLLLSLALWQGWTFTSFLGSLFESLVICLPPLLSLTSLSDSPELVIIPITVLGVFILLLASRNKTKNNDVAACTTSSSKVFYITNYRASMLLITTICILAVDFPLFPRRLGKTETFGYGLMDLGVGSFVFSNGLVSLEARGLEPSLKESLFSSVPLLVLGLLRLVSLSMTGYHHIVTEYGKHWNFFFSLAAVKLGSVFFGSVLREGRQAWVLAVAVAVFHEGVLSWGVQDWVLGDGPRDHLLEANREGVVSSLGYLALYIAGVAWGKDLLLLSSTAKDLATSGSLLTVWSLLMWLSLAYCCTFFPPPSRRLANYNFFTWTLAYNLTLLAGFCLLDLLLIFVAEYQESKKISKSSKSKKVPDNARMKILKKPQSTLLSFDLYRSPGLYQAISYNGLAFFLLANLGTGGVNMCVSTITTPTLPALAILTAYLLILCLVIMVLWRRGIQLKCW